MQTKIFVLNIKSLYILTILILISVLGKSQSDFKNPEEYAKQANKLFEDGEFQKAYPFYQTLRSNYTDNPDYNFRLGVCMMYSEPEDKARPIYYFKNALKYNIEDNRVYYYLGRAYHNNYRFGEAKSTYTEYKDRAKEKKVKSFDIDRRIEECNNGIALLSHIKLLYVVDKRLVKDATFYKSYIINNSLAKIIAVPDDLKTRYDIKHKSPSFGIFIPEGNILYYASYGAKGEKGLDIYRVKQNPGNGWEKPENLGDNVNTNYDDAFPFVTPDGSTLYFSSKGHNSMGGYDIFKSEFSLSSFSWSNVENLNFPVNTPFDDVFFVPDTSKNLAYFSSDRQSLSGQIYVYHIGLDKQSEEQDLAKAFREGGDDTDLAKLLKDIADLKTNINVDDYKSKIKKEIDNDANKADEKENNNVIANNNPIKKIDLDDSKQLDYIVNESYNSYKKISYRAIKLQKQKNSIGKIAAENDKIALELKAKGDEKSIANSKKYQKAAAVSRKIADSLNVQINKTEAAASQILVQSGYLQRYAGMHNKDSVELIYAKINRIKANVDIQNDVAYEIIMQEQALIRSKRDDASAKYKENQDAINALNDLKSELKEYKDALNTVSDESEREEYKEMIAAMEIEVAKKTAAQKAIEEDYNQLRTESDDTALALSKVDEVYNDYVNANKENNDSLITEQEEILNQEIAVAQKEATKYINDNAETVVASTENTNADNTETNSEQGQENNQELNSETVASTENTNAANTETNSEQGQENGQELNSETVASTENTNAANTETNSEQGQENNQELNSETVASTENTNNENSAKQSQNGNIEFTTVGSEKNVKNNNLGSNKILPVVVPVVKNNNNESTTNSENQKQNNTNLNTTENSNSENNSEIASNENSNETNSNSENQEQNNTNLNTTENTNSENTTEIASNENSNETNSNSENQEQNNTNLNITENTNNENNSEIASNENSNETNSNSANSENLAQISAAANNENISNIESLNQEIIAKIDSNNVEISGKKNTLESVISSNNKKINNLISFANSEYQQFVKQNDSANQLINNFNYSEVKSQKQIDEISRLKNESQEHKMNSISAYGLAQNIKQKNSSNANMLSQLDNIEMSNNYGENTNYDSLQQIANNTSYILASINSKELDKDSILNAHNESLSSLNEISSRISEQENILESLDNEKSQLINQGAKETELENINNRIESVNNSISTLKREEIAAQTIYNKLNSEKTALAIADNVSQNQNPVNNEISGEIETLSNEETIYDNSNLTNEIAILESKVDNNTSQVAIIPEAIQDEDSVYIPQFNQNNLNSLASKYLEPSLIVINDIKAEETQIQSKQLKTITAANEYDNISKSLLNDINALKENLANSQNSTENQSITAEIKDKQKQYIAIKRKQIAANLYSNLLTEESAELEKSANGIVSEFKTNRKNISLSDTNNLSLIAVNSISDSLSKNPVDKFISNLNSNLELEKNRLAELSIQKDKISQSYSEKLQKLDQISYEIEQTDKPRKLEKLQAQLKEIEPIANSLSLQLENINAQSSSISDSIAQNENIIAALNQHSQYLNSAENISENQSIENISIASESKEIDLSIFNNDSRMSKEELGMAYVEVPQEQELPYYVTNSIDLVYFDENDIPMVRYMMVKKQAQFIKQQIDLLKSIDLSKYNANQQQIVDNKISTLEDLQRKVDSQMIELGNLVVAEGGSIDNVDRIDNNFIQNVSKQVAEYNLLSQRLMDTSQYFNGYEKQKVIALSKKLSNKADSINSIFIELNELKIKAEYQENELKLAQFEVNAPEGQLTNQAKMQIDEANQNLSLAENSRVSSENPNLNVQEKKQLIDQAVQYEQMALRNQKNAIGLFQTQTENIAANDINSEQNNANNNIDASQFAENSSQENTNEITGLSNQEAINNTSENNVQKSNVNSKTIELEELALIDPTKLNEEEKVNYEVRKADILGAFIGDRNTDINIDFYSEEKPIEINPEVPNGLSYKVQIAAFRKPIPQNTFGDIKPISAETIPTSAFTRYMAGLFLNYSDANTAKNQLRRKGYPGAFVVPYYNGVRITNAQANAIINRGEAYTDSKLIVAAEKLSVNNFGKNRNLETIAQKTSPDATGNELNSELQASNSELIYSVQIGVFGGLRTSARLANTGDLFYDITSRGYYRYFSGKFTQEQAAIEARNIIRSNGITDAFVVAFYKGKKTSITNARKIEQTIPVKTNITEQEQNITDSNKVIATNTNIDQNIVYKVQIGAFRSPRKGDQLAVLQNISLNGLDTYSNKSGLLIYTSKSYSTYQEAINTRDQIRANGNTDVFVVAFEDGVRISTRIARNKLGF